MKNLVCFIILLLGLQIHLNGQSILELGPSQSMCITGKGPGQDAAINPYSKSDAFGIVENIGNNEFRIRIQNQNKIIKMIIVKPKEIKKVVLLKGYALFFDSELSSKAKVKFEEMLN